LSVFPNKRDNSLVNENKEILFSTDATNRSARQKIVRVRPEKMREELPRPQAPPRNRAGENFSKEKSWWRSTKADFFCSRKTAERVNFESSNYFLLLAQF